MAPKAKNFHVLDSAELSCDRKESALNDKLSYSTICQYGTGQQDMATCRMIYIHWQGYYPTNEAYQFALEHLCPNFQR